MTESHEAARGILRAVCVLESVLEGSFAGDHDPNRAEQNFDIVPHAAVLKVQQVVGNLATKTFQFIVITVDDLAIPVSPGFRPSRSMKLGI